MTQPDLDGRTLRYSLAMVRQSSVRSATDVLHVRASAISLDISTLESRLGLPLLGHLPHGVVPTEASAAIAEHARQQLEDGD